MLEVVTSELSHRSVNANAPIGVFDSGYGGLTVLYKMRQMLPGENIIFIGDNARCPYGPRPQAEVERFVMEICDYLVRRGCKMIVIACNTATSAGLASAQKHYNIPIIGVIEPGARAAATITQSRHVGVIATFGTIASNAYARAIRNVDAGINIMSKATPKFVDMVESGIRVTRNESEQSAQDRALRLIAENYLASFRDSEIDTLVLGCTHFPLISGLIQEVVGDGIHLVSSADETALEVARILSRRGELRIGDGSGECEYLTTGDDLGGFRLFGSVIMGEDIGEVQHVSIGLPEEMRFSNSATASNIAMANLSKFAVSS